MSAAMVFSLDENRTKTNGLWSRNGKNHAKIDQTKTGLCFKLVVTRKITWNQTQLGPECVWIKVKWRAKMHLWRRYCQNACDPSMASCKFEKIRTHKVIGKKLLKIFLYCIPFIQIGIGQKCDALEQPQSLTFNLVTSRSVRKSVLCLTNDASYDEISA